MKLTLIIGLIIIVGLIMFLLWGLYYHQPICYKECEEAEVKYEEINGELFETNRSCSDMCYKFLFDGKEIWFFNWRIK